MSFVFNHIDYFQTYNFHLPICISYWRLEFIFIMRTSNIILHWQLSTTITKQINLTHARPLCLWQINREWNKVLVQVMLVISTSQLILIRNWMIGSVSWAWAYHCKACSVVNYILDRTILRYPYKHTDVHGDKYSPRKATRCTMLNTVGLIPIVSHKTVSNSSMSGWFLWWAGHIDTFDHIFLFCYLVICIRFTCMIDCSLYVWVSIPSISQK